MNDVIQLTKRELDYATRQFRNVRLVVTMLFPVYLLICLVSLPFIFLDKDTFWIGIGFLLFGLLGAIFFKRYSNKTKFKIVPTARVMRGKLNQRLVGFGNHRHHRLFLDDFLMETPAGLEMYLWELIDQYSGKKVSVHVAVCQQEKEGKLHEYYTPLKIEKDLCIDSAIKHHGKNFLRTATRQLYFDITMIILLFCAWFFLAFGISEFFDFELSVLLLLVILVVGLIGSERLYTTLFPRNHLELKEKLTCYDH